MLLILKILIKLINNIINTVYAIIYFLKNDNNNYCYEYNYILIDLLLKVNLINSVNLLQNFIPKLI